MNSLELSPFFKPTITQWNWAPLLVPNAALMMCQSWFLLLDGLIKDEVRTASDFEILAIKANSYMLCQIRQPEIGFYLLCSGFISRHLWLLFPSVICQKYVW